MLQAKYLKVLNTSEMIFILMVSPLLGFNRTITHQDKKCGILSCLGDIFSSLFGGGGGFCNKAIINKTQQNLDVLSENQKLQLQVQDGLSLINLTQIEAGN